MQQIEQGNYTREEIINALHGVSGSREINFKYNLLNKNEIKKSEIDTVVSAEISNNSLLDIKRTARFSIKDDNTIDWLNDRIQPFIMLKMPDGGWCQWSLGIFLLSSPIRKEQNGKVYREVEAYDGLQVFKDDKLDSRYTLDIGTNYISVIISILNSAGITKYNLQQTTSTLQTTREWEPGTEKLAVINELLQEIAYTQLWVDEYGFYTAAKYRLPSERAIDYSYIDNDMSVTYNGMSEELDLFSIPNKWVVVKSNAESSFLVSTLTNSNPDSITSTVSRGRTIVDYRTIDNIADQTALDDYTKRLAFEASQVYGHVTFESAIMPMHSYNDCLEVAYSSLGIVGKYVETSWSMQLVAGAKMRHDVRRMVSI